MKKPASGLVPYTAPILLSLLTACGGGADDAAPIVPPVAPAPPTAVITSINPATAVLDRPTDFEISGTDLSDGMRFQMAECVGIAEAAGGSKTRRVFSCTPSGAVGNHALQIYASADASASLAGKAINYVTPVLKVAEVNGKLNVLKADGSLWVWENDSAASTPGNVVITRTQLGSNFKSMEAGDFFSLAINADGDLWAWGFSNDGAFANSPVTHSATPVQIGKNYRQVAPKGSHTSGGARVVGLKQDGTLWAWGASSSPVPNAIDTQYTPHQFGTGFNDLATGSTGESMALKADGTLYSWTENISDTPFVLKKFGDDYQTVASAYAETLAIKKNGELWAWGRNAPNRQQAGSDDAPALVGQGYASLSAGAYYVMALKADGTLWGYGSNSEGQLGEGGGSIQVAADVRNVWAVDHCTIIEKRDGTLWGTQYCVLGITSGLGPKGFHQLPQF